MKVFDISRRTNFWRNFADVQNFTWQIRLRWQNLKWNFVKSEQSFVCRSKILNKNFNILFVGSSLTTGSKAAPLLIDWPWMCYSSWQTPQMISLQLPSLVEVHPNLLPPSLVSCWPGCQYHDHRLSSPIVFVSVVILLLGGLSKNHCWKERRNQLFYIAGKILI